MSNWLREFVVSMLVGHASTVWPLVAAPAAAAGLLRLSLPFIERMPAGERSQRITAFAAATIPAAVFWCIAISCARVMPLHNVPSFDCLMHCLVLGSIICFVPLRASIQAYTESSHLKRLLALCESPSPRLRRAASQVGLTASELSTPEPICCIAGFLRPRVLVSTGALSLLNDEELRAALLHERAHVRSRETLWVSLATFLHRSAPVRSSHALALFRTTGDFAADREATGAADPLVLVRSLFRFSDRVPPEPMMINFAAPHNVVSRARRILGGDAETSNTGIVAVLLLAASASLALLPLALRVAGAAWCHRL